MEYSGLFAEYVPHYCIEEIAAEDLEEAIGHRNTGNLDFDDPDWNNPVCLRIIHIEDGQEETAVDDIPLDEFIIRSGGEANRRLCDNAEDMLNALESGHGKN
jgi:hypothetical protein